VIAGIFSSVSIDNLKDSIRRVRTQFTFKLKQIGQAEIAIPGPVP
jgi:hypothetical protein